MSDIKQMKLSKTQQELLDAIASGVTVHFSPYAGRFNPHEYYWRDDTMKRCTAAASALVDKGFVDKVDVSWRGHKLRAKK